MQQSIHSKMADIIQRLRFCASNPGHDEITLGELAEAADRLAEAERLLRLLENRGRDPWDMVPIDEGIAAYFRAADRESLSHE